MSPEIKTWPFIEAKRLAQRVANQKEIVFETGYGASGLPHIGTFAEVARTIMVRRAFEHLMPEVKTKLICFSDDMDALRKVPENLPEQAMLAAHLEKPLSNIPDPFGTHPSFADHNNARLCAFLDRFGFDYEFASATDYYRSGKFDPTLQKILEHYDTVKNIILPTLGKERQASYSPFLPLCPRTGRVLMVEIIQHDVQAGTITYRDPETQENIKVPITGGACKLQWKVDWAMRWIALGVDYEMSGKDLIDSVKLSNKICNALQAQAPLNYAYELFLDEHGQKISKSRGNGLTIEEWLHYAPLESLMRFLYRSPKSAKRLHFDVIPSNVDDYLKDSAAWAQEDEEARKKNACWFIRSKKERHEEPHETPVMSFSLLLNLVSASQADNADMLWGFVSTHAPEASPQSHPFLAKLIEHALAYFNDFVKPYKKYRTPSAKEKIALQNLLETFQALDENATAEEIQGLVYEVGKTNHFDKLRDWFSALYQILLGQKSGSRFGTFVALYGLRRTESLIEKALAAEDLAQ